MTAHTPSDPRSGRRSKSTLFCPECGHESDVAGDWLVSDDPNRTDRTCPECGATIEHRHEPAPAMAR